MKKPIKAIPTTYRGITFRSKLETSWAKFFDKIGMNWAYEEEGYELPDGTWYLPDFWLPNCKTFFEVKGLLNDTDMNKMKQLAECVAPKGIFVAIGSSPIPNSLGLVYPIPFHCMDEIDLEDGEGFVSDKDLVEIAICAKCHKPYIIWLNQGWSCRNCGYYEGDSTWESLVIRETQSPKFIDY